MWQIPIYSAEKKDGLADLIRANASIAYNSLARLVKKESEQEVIKQLYKQTVAGSNKAQFDLFYLDTILVTTGWNLNDDIFLKEPTWAARHSPEDKPFNYGHNQLDIIGHITNNSVVNDEYKVIADDSALDDVPDKFHILTSAVIYKIWADKTQAERIEKIISEIPEGKWFVSMEALFFGFDYAVQASDGSQRIIARNDESAFLTKHLRAYGGTGVYQDMKIGRALSKLIFSGKGLVENPANPDSIIFNNVVSFKSTFANLGYINSYGSKPCNSEEIDMADNDRTAEMQKELDKANAKIEELTKKLNEIQAQNVKAHEDKINNLNSTIAEANQKIKVAEDRAEAAEKAQKAAEAEAKVAKDKASELEKNAEKNKKTSKVKAAGIPEGEVEAFLKEWDGATEAQFDKALELWSKANKAAEPTPIPKTEENSEKVINSAETPPAPAAAAANVPSESVEKTQASLSEFLGKCLDKNRNRKR